MESKTQKSAKNNLDEQICAGRELCCGCRACEQVCPMGCIEMTEDSEGFLYPKFDYAKCIYCDKCLAVCSGISISYHSNIQKAYAAYHKDRSIREQSSSGGIFYALASAVLQQNGVVFGASYDENYLVKHKKISKVEQIPSLMGSKYLQSDMEDSVSEIRKELDAGKAVLFSGTPCQVAAVKSALQRKYNRFIGVSVMCHGVPSPKVWKKYLDIQKDKWKLKNIRDIQFRDKLFGDGNWTNLVLVIRDENREIGKSYQEDLYYQGFLNDIILRPSCYSCRAKGRYPAADIIIGDYWGIKYVKPDYFDESGVSAVIVNTDKGKRVFEHIAEQIQFSECDYRDISDWNPNLLYSVADDENIRDKFFRDFIAGVDLMTILGQSVSLKKKKQEQLKYKRKIRNNIPVVLWGAGRCYEKLILRVMEICTPLYVVDADAAKWGKNLLAGLTCKSPDVLETDKNVFVVIMVEDPKIAFQIANELLDRGIRNMEWIKNWFDYAENCTWSWAV